MKVAIPHDDRHLYDCLVVGGGISGSTLAHNLHASHGVDVLLCESSDRLGGNVRTATVRDEDGTFLYEEGPGSFEASPSVMRISRELDLEDEVVFAPGNALSPWIHRAGGGRGGVHPLPRVGKFLGPGGLLNFVLFDDLLTWRGKLRACAGAFLGHAPPPSPPGGGAGEETIEGWSTRTLGEEAYTGVIEPIVSGIYAGDPSRLSARAALPKLSRTEEGAYGLRWNAFGALFYGALAIRRGAGPEEGPAGERDDADDRRPPRRAYERGRTGSYRTGLTALPDAIMDELGPARVRLRWKLTNVDWGRDDGVGGYAATFEARDDDGALAMRTVRARTLVVTVPAHAVGTALDGVLPGSSALLAAADSGGGVPYPPVASVALAYPKSSFLDVDLPDGSGNLRDLPGYGVVSARSAGVRTLATLFVSSLFPGRCPDGYNLLSSTVGGTRDAAVGAMSEDDIVAAVDGDLRVMLIRPDAPPPKVLGVKVWPRAIPQYELGHADKMAELKRMEDANDVGGLWVCGSYRTGVSLTACVNFGYDHAKVVADHLANKKMINEAPSTQVH